MSQPQPQSLSQPPGPAAPPAAPADPTVVVVSGNVQKYAMKKKKILNAEESELFELTQAAGVTVDQEVFKIIVDLLKMNVAPQAVFQTLKAMCAGQRIADTSGVADTSAGPHPPSTSGATSTQTTTATAPAEHRDEDTTLVPSKSSKPPASSGPSSVSGPRATRLGSKMVYSPQESSSAQVRSKAAHGDKSSRESSSQRVQRPPSATRGQKAKSSGGSSSSSSQIASN